MTPRPPRRPPAGPSAWTKLPRGSSAWTKLPRGSSAWTILAALLALLTVETAGSLAAEPRRDAGARISLASGGRDAAPAILARGAAADPARPTPAPAAATADAVGPTSRHGAAAPAPARVAAPDVRRFSPRQPTGPPAA